MRLSSLIHNSLNNGIAVATAAGNEAIQHYQGNWVDNDDGSTLTPDGRHEFAPFDNSMRILLEGNPPMLGLETVGAAFFMQWAEPFGQAGQDFAFCLASGPNEEDRFACDNFVQDGDDDPLESLFFECDVIWPATSCQVYIQVGKFEPPGPITTVLELFALGPITIPEPADFVEEDSIFGHPAVDGVITTATINAGDPDNDDIAFYSSRGPSTFCLFGGSDCTQPAGQSVRNQPAITGIDGVDVTTAGLGTSPFFGTSAAAPHLAAIAALMLEANLTLTPAALLAGLQSTADDRGAPGFDNTFGAGLANALAAVNSVLLPPAPPTADSVTPSSGSGTAAMFSYQASDPNGSQDLSSIQVIVNEAVTGVNSCYLAYQAASNLLYLRNDAGSGWLGPQALGLPGLLQNAKCSVDVGNSSVTSGGLTLTLDLDLQFLQPGAKTNYLMATDTASQSSGWVNVGTWAATSAIPQPPTADSVTPSSGSGTGTVFSYQASDPNGAQDLSSIQVIVNEAVTGVNSCYLAYQAASNLLYLRNDAGSGWLGPQALGLPGLLQNAKCSVDVGNSAQQQSPRLRSHTFYGCATCWSRSARPGASSAQWLPMTGYSRTGPPPCNA